MIFVKFNARVEASMRVRRVNYLDFFRTVGKSKRLSRSGWVREKVKEPESVAEHSFRVGVLAMILSDKLNVDKDKLIKMALIHDLGEVFTGDIVWMRGEVVDIKMREEKEEEELKSLIGLFEMIYDDSYIKIFEEMLERITKEAKVFWQLDKLEMAIQALEYEEMDGKNLEEFFMNTDLFIQEPLLREIFNQIMEKRYEKREGTTIHESI